MMAQESQIAYTGIERRSCLERRKAVERRDILRYDSILTSRRITLTRRNEDRFWQTHIT